MSEIWNTKYGKRRVRKEPATLEDAIYAAQGLSDELEMQIEIASSLIDLPRETVKAALVKKSPLKLNTSRIASRTPSSSNGSRSAA